MITIYHNPRCSKSRECLAFIENSENQFETIRYMEEKLNYGQLKDIIGKLGIKPIALVRTKEDVWTEKFKGKTLTNRQIIAAMIKFPELMERPIAVNGEKAVIARPLDRIREII